MSAAPSPALVAMASPVRVPRPARRPVTFARVFWHFVLAGWTASLVGLVVLPRVLARYAVSEARITGWSLYVWLGLLALLLAPLVRDVAHDWTSE